MSGPDESGLGPPAQRHSPATAPDNANRNLLESDLRLAHYFRSLSRVMVAAAHDIRAPFNAMVLNLELLEGTLAPDAPAGTRQRHERYVGILREEINRLHRMLETVFTHLLPANEKVGPFDLRILAEDLKGLLGSYLRSVRVELRVAMPESALMVDGNHDTLKQVVFGIALHALEGVPPGSALDVSFEERDGSAILAILPAQLEDNSIDDSSRFRADGVTGASAVGIPVAVALGVVDAHGGKIQVIPGYAGGSRFEITLPLSPQATPGVSCLPR